MLLLPVSPWVIFVAFLSLAAGVGQGLILKWQNRHKYQVCVYDEYLLSGQRCEDSHFTQAFLQTLFMFGGECFAILFWICRPRQRSTPTPPSSTAPATDIELAAGGNRLRSNPFSSEEDDRRTAGGGPPPLPTRNTQQHLTTPLPPPRAKGSLDKPCPWWWWTTPAPLDFIECALGNMALTITYTSTVQMLHNFMVIASALFSMTVLHRALRRHEWLGCTIITAALILTGIPALLSPEEETDYDSNYHWLGICLAIISTSVHALQNIWEEALFMKGRISAMLAVGVEGATGVAITLAALPAIQLSGLEKPFLGIHQLRRNRFLQFTMGLYALTSLMNNAAGVVLTKWTSGLLRCVFMALRPPIVWGVEVALRWNSFDWFNVGALILLMVGLWVHLLGYPLSHMARISDFLRVPVFCGMKLDTPQDELMMMEKLSPPEASTGTPASSSTKQAFLVESAAAPPAAEVNI